MRPVSASLQLAFYKDNVLATITDRKIFTHIKGDCKDGKCPILEPDIASGTDYTPFGLAMAGRTYRSKGYRYGFNGKENDADGEWGRGLIQDYGFRLYNPAASRFLSVDPLRMEYPWYTPYQFAGNKPIWAIDLDGLEEYYSTTGQFLFKWGNSPEIRVVKKGNEDIAMGVFNSSPNKRNPKSKEIYFNRILPRFSSKFSPNSLSKVDAKDKKLVGGLIRGHQSNIFGHLDLNLGDIKIGWSNLATMIDEKGNVFIKKGSNEDEIVLGLAWEFQNSRNAKGIASFRQGAADMTKDEYVLGILKFEAQAVYARVLVGINLGIPMEKLGVDPTTYGLVLANPGGGEDVFNKIAINLRSGKNGEGKTADQAYGSQWEYYQRGKKTVKSK